jgi:hypothetical protein
MKVRGIGSIFVAFLLVNLCSCANVKLPNSQTASEQFSRLSNGQKSIAKNFYDLGQGDAIKRLYWAQRDAQQPRTLSGSDAPAPVSLERKYVVLPVPEHVEPDGTIKEASNQVVEVVQFYSVVRRPHGRVLFVVR